MAAGRICGGLPCPVQLTGCCSALLTWCFAFSSSCHTVQGCHDA